MMRRALALRLIMALSVPLWAVACGDAGPGGPGGPGEGAREAGSVPGAGAELRVGGGSGEGTSGGAASGAETAPRVLATAIAGDGGHPLPIVGTLAPLGDVERRSRLEDRWSHPAPERLGLGRRATAADIAALDIDVRPDGRGLPPGSGSVAEGERLFAEACVACHGPEGVGGPEGSLVGRNPGDPFLFGDGVRGARTIGSYWPWATTVFDYVRRAMPWDRPGSLTDAQVYAVTAYLLHRNGLLEADAVLDAQSLPAIVMPARDRYVIDDRELTNGVR
jgi:cytochrome c